MGSSEQTSTMPEQARPLNRARFLVVFHVVSAGLNGDNLGSDEEDIVLIIYLVYDAEKNKVRQDRSRH